MNLTIHTDPKTIMLEGRPEIEIVAISDRNYPDPQGRVAVYIEHAPGLDKDWQAGTGHTSFKGRMGQSTHSNVFYKPDGTLSPSRFNSPDYPLANWPRIVPRVALNASKPLIATTAEGETFRYRVTGIFTPMDPAGEAIVHVSPIDRPTAVDLEIYASTGKVTPGMGQNGIALKFSNGPHVQKTGVVVNAGGHLISLNLTLTDGELTNVEWIK